jgi:hypothetical protein
MNNIRKVKPLLHIKVCTLYLGTISADVSSDTIRHFWRGLFV